ncbi:MAG TPA: glycosyltransferase family 4 protein [Thermoanaerobaculia bacterium]|jgi:glycosyltransferase involved in cell wall biosynthesis|nr:glycosyltransferase family 4 protein [Thermoanaerobaculia bacterium]
MKVWVISEVFYPEDTSTGYFLTRIAEELARAYNVGVLTAQPTYAARGVRAPRRERWHGMDIVRGWSTRFDKDRLALRVLNLVTLTASLFTSALLRVRRGDVVLFVTNPPTLPFALAAACRMRGATPLLLVHDVYPHAIVAAGMARRGGLLWRLGLMFNRRLYARVAKVIAIGRDMARLASEMTGGRADVAVIPNWADIGEIVPKPRAENPILRERGLAGKFVVQYAGNMGRTHAVELLAEAARRLRHRQDIHFLFAGFGAKRALLERELHDAPNATLLPRQEREALNDLLNACDVSVIAFEPGMSGVSVPSRMYNVLASGRPLLAVADADSEPAMVIAEEGVGWRVEPGDVSGLVAAIELAAGDAELVRATGARARKVAEEKYTLAKIGEQYRALVGARASRPLTPRRARPSA